MQKDVPPIFTAAELELMLGKEAKGKYSVLR